MAAKISLALGGAKRQAKPAPINGVKRSHAALREEEEEGHDDGRSQTVSHFDRSAGGAIDEETRQRVRGPLVIAPQANRDWKDASKRRRQQHVLPGGAQVGGQDVSEQTIRELEASKPGYGLNVTKRESESEEPLINGHAEQRGAEGMLEEPNGDVSIQQKTDDELAMDALLGNTTRSELVLPAASEEEAFERDYNTAPDMASLDDYARVPVEQFGAALLRGMGWKEGEGIGSQKGLKVLKTKVPERRPALLGIGAKEEAAVAQEMGTWGKAAKRGGEVKVYNPILLKDKKTGELFTEDELQKRREKEEKRQYEEEFERKEREREKKGDRREDDGVRDKDRNHDRPRRNKDETGDSRDRRREKDRRQDRDRGDDRDRPRHDDSEDEYYRRKEKERKRRERDRYDSEYDSGRSRRHDSDRERHRDRDRDHR